MDNVGTFDLQI